MTWTPPGFIKRFSKRVHACQNRIYPHNVALILFLHYARCASWATIIQRYIPQFELLQDQRDLQRFHLSYSRSFKRNLKCTLCSVRLYKGTITKYQEYFKKEVLCKAILSFAYDERMCNVVSKIYTIWLHFQLPKSNISSTFKGALTRVMHNVRLHIIPIVLQKLNKSTLRLFSKMYLVLKQCFHTEFDVLYWYTFAFSIKSAY